MDEKTDQESVPSGYATQTQPARRSWRHRFFTRLTTPLPLIWHLGIWYGLLAVALGIVIIVRAIVHGFR